VQRGKNRPKTEKLDFREVVSGRQRGAGPEHFAPQLAGTSGVLIRAITSGPSPSGVRVIGHKSSA
jgi:hypothetical protein